MGHKRIFDDYLADDAVYTDKLFRRRFRMKKRLLQKILNDIENSGNEFFTQKPDACGKPGASPLQKVTAALRMLAKGVSADSLDDYVRLGESTVLRCLKEFCATIVDLYGEEYLRQPTEQDIQRLLKENEDRGFPGCLGSVDCMHWKWKNCPRAWAGQFSGKEKEPTLVLEAVASKDLWFWHCFFGLPGSLNDINVLERSPLFDDLLQGKAPPCSYSIRGTPRSMGYYLADGIYPRWPTFVQTFSQPDTPMKRLFAKKQEARRKDVERAFDVLQARWHILTRPSTLWFREDMAVIVRACVILHNMIVEDQRGDREADPVLQEEREERGAFNRPREALPNADVSTLAKNMMTLRDERAWASLRHDLIEHLWERQGRRAS